MTEGSTDELRPKTILIQSGQTEDVDEPAPLDQEGLPPPVKAAPWRAVPTTPKQSYSLTKLGLMAVFLSPMMFLFLDLVPATKQSGFATLSIFMLTFGLLFILLDASKAERRKPQPKSINITIQDAAEKEVVSIEPAPETNQNNPEIDEDDEPDSFWEDMLQENAESPMESPTKGDNEIPLSSTTNAQGELGRMLLMLFFAFPFLVVISLGGGVGACLAASAFFIPVILIAGAPEIFTAGFGEFSALDVVLMIAVGLLLIIGLA